MTRQIILIRNVAAVVLLAALLAFLVWSAVGAADAPTLSPPEWPTATAPAPGATAAPLPTPPVGGYPGPDPYPAPYPAPGAYLPLVEAYP